MKYKCIKSVKTSQGEAFYYGQTITDNLYKLMTPLEQRHFVNLIQDFPQKENKVVPDRFKNDFHGDPNLQPGNNFDNLKD